MLLFVKLACGRTTAVQVAAGDTVESLRLKAGLGTEELLSFGGAFLCDKTLLTESGLQRESTVHVTLPVEGGKGKKKKKKNFTKPKKKSHRHKLEKMRALKYFKVTENDDGSYKVERTRDECPNPNCGAGVFLARHSDRKYCGKCHLTYTAK
ncbi:putative Ribosomal protein S27a [Trypanosoma vivax]|uniref:Ubiquitin-ribosomal protein eL40 fusion protein n=1 Tax=Trypanosoma vivax (strain Y486) TaxID=1055687 RepID=G0U6F4_TRYVY|nr:putative ubiquitin/ribosomal protein S27a [Trypanosoma vivax]KAH8611492.1 putative Ribosomal protein S27a [Trypanosoma vivax]CCC51458.1 putative ubiquitin/ribosomal protein S27a [Trypanosoma vivax Y486]